MKVAIASMPYQLTHVDLELVLAITRTGAISTAGVRLGIDPSSVFRSLQRLEKAIGTSLFKRNHQGCTPTELGIAVGFYAERMEAELEAARVLIQDAEKEVKGVVRITSTDVLLNRLVLPALVGLRKKHPLLRFDTSASYEIANLSKREADIALRATRKPPQHLVGRRLGFIEEAIFGRGDRLGIDESAWVSFDESIPGHPSIVWRKRHYPDAAIAVQVDSIQSALNAVLVGLGIGILPIFIANKHRELVQLSPVIDGLQTELWLLIPPASRNIRRVNVVFKHLSETVVLD